MKNNWRNRKMWHLRTTKIRLYQITDISIYRDIVFDKSFSVTSSITLANCSSINSIEYLAITQRKDFRHFEYKSNNPEAASFWFCMKDANEKLDASNYFIKVIYQFQYQKSASVTGFISNRKNININVTMFPSYLELIGSMPQACKQVSK